MGWGRWHGQSPGGQQAWQQHKPEAPILHCCHSFVQRAQRGLCASEVQLPAQRVALTRDTDRREDASWIGLVTGMGSRDIPGPPSWPCAQLKSGRPLRIFLLFPVQTIPNSELPGEVLSPLAKTLPWLVPLAWVTCMHSRLAPDPSTQQRLPCQPAGTLPHFTFDTPTLCASLHYRDFSFSCLASSVSQGFCSGEKNSREIRVDGKQRAAGDKNKRKGRKRG